MEGQKGVWFCTLFKHHRQLLFHPFLYFIIVYIEMDNVFAQPRRVYYRPT
jgi:hypothetical protein